MEENNVKSRIFHFMEYKGLSQSKFEKAVGLSNGYLNNLRHSPSTDKTSMILEAFPEINRVWLLSGVGPMLVDDEVKNKELPLIPQSAMAGALAGELQEWGKMRTFASVTAENISAFDGWLHSKALGDAGVYNYHKTLRAILSDAVLFERIIVNPYSRLKFSRGERQTIDYLTEEEFTRLRNVQLPSSMLEHARDLFVFQTYIALSYSDLCEFDIKSYRHERGRYYKVDSTREKTGMKFVTVLLPPAVEIGEKYNWKLPIICNADYNRALKLVAAAAGISHSLHSHMARSTFATLAISHGARIQNVAKMLGHASVSMTLKRYGEILEHDVIEDFERLSGEI